jgi:RNA polymerase sigma factor (sigma-70 family)
MNDCFSTLTPGTVERPLHIPSEEQALIASALEGDQLAWTNLVQRLSPILRGTVRSYLGLNDIDEALQNTWIRVWNSLNKYDSKVSPFIAFCRWHAKNAAIDLLRRNRYKQHEFAAEDLVARTGSDSDLDHLGWLAPNGPSEEELDREFFDEVLAPELLESIYCQFMRLTFSMPVPPHELICYGFNKVLGWKPRRIVSDMGSERIDAVEGRLEIELKQESELSAAMIEECFAGLRLRLASRLGELVSDRRTRNRYDSLMERVVAGTVLQEYFSNDPSGDISAWWWGVHRQVVKEAELHRTPEVDRVLEKLI